MHPASAPPAPPEFISRTLATPPGPALAPVLELASARARVQAQASASAAPTATGNGDGSGTGTGTGTDNNGGRARVGAGRNNFLTNLSALLGNGNGTFQTAVPITVAAQTA